MGDEAPRQCEARYNGVRCLGTIDHRGPYHQWEPRPPTIELSLAHATALETAATVYHSIRNNRGTLLHACRGAAGCSLLSALAEIDRQKRTIADGRTCPMCGKPMDLGSAFKDGTGAMMYRCPTGH